MDQIAYSVTFPAPIFKLDRPSVASFFVFHPLNVYPVLVGLLEKSISAPYCTLALLGEILFPPLASYVTV